MRIKAIFQIIIVLVAVFLVQNYGTKGGLQLDQELSTRGSSFVSILQILSPACLSAQTVADTNPESSLLNLLDTLFIELYSNYRETSRSEFARFCNKFGIDSSNIDIQKSYYEVNFYHDLLTGNGATNCIKGGFLEIPYFWHWINPNPRHKILMLPDSIPLSSVNPPAEFARYKSHADIDRVPSIFLADLVTDRPRYYHRDCGAFYTFGWCSEREMSFCFILSGNDYRCKIKQEGIHTWSEVLIPFSNNNGEERMIVAMVDNTFNMIEYSLLDENISQDKWLEEYGSGSDIEWYNQVFRSEDQKKKINGLKISEEVKSKIKSQINVALKR